MTDFETRLRTRVEHLDAAIPAPQPPSIVLRPTSRPRRRRQVIVLLAATVALLGTMSLVTSGAEDPKAIAAQDSANAAAEDLVLDQLGPIVATQCLTAAEALPKLRDGLDALGLRDWTITSLEGASASRCVSFGADAENRVVDLIPSIGPDVAAAMQAVADQLMRGCLNEDGARGLISSALGKLGVTGWTVRTDGPLAIPIGQEHAVQSHIAAGCFVYSGSQSQSDGGRIFYINGP